MKRSGMDHTVCVCACVCGAIYGSAFWEGCLKAFSVSVSAVSYLQVIKLFGFFITFLGRLTAALLQFIVSVVVISVLYHRRAHVYSRRRQSRE